VGAHERYKREGNQNVSGGIQLLRRTDFKHHKKKIKIHNRCGTLLIQYNCYSKSNAHEIFVEIMNTTRKFCRILHKYMMMGVNKS
jgi:hypothetical protein